MSEVVVIDGQPIAAATGLRTRSVSPGGYGGCTFNLNRKLNQSLLDTFAKVAVYDTATGECVNAGRLLDQGRNNDGTWQVSALGQGPASLGDITTPYFLIDQSLDNWVMTSRTTPRMSGAVGVYPGAPNDIDSLMLTTREDKDIVAGASLEMTNKIATLTDQNIGGFGFRRKEGFGPNANWRTQGRVYTAGMGTADTVFDVGWDGGAMSVRHVSRVGTDWTNPRPIAAVRFARINTTITATESQWAVANDPIIRAQIYGQDGSLLTSGYLNEYVLIHEAFIDWCVRYAPLLDIAHARIDQGTHQFDQLAWLDGVNGMQVLDDLLEMEQGFTWHVWEEGPFGYKTELIQLPTKIQYEADASIDFQAPSPSTDLYDRATVTGTSPGGRDVNVTVTSPVDALTKAGIHREDTIRSGAEVWSTANATKSGNTYLAAHKVPGNAGTLTVASLIFDRLSGRWIPPSFIRAGGLIQVRGVQATPDALNANSPDGVTVFRIVSTEYDADAGVCKLELDSYTLAQANAIAALANARTRRNR